MASKHPMSQSLIKMHRTRLGTKAGHSFPHFFQNSNLGTHSHSHFQKVNERHDLYSKLPTVPHGWWGRCRKLKRRWEVKRVFAWALTLSTEALPLGIQPSRIRLSTVGLATSPLWRCGDTRYRGGIMVQPATLSRKTGSLTEELCSLWVWGKTVKHRVSFQRICSPSFKYLGWDNNSDTWALKIYKPWLGS